MPRIPAVTGQEAVDAFGRAGFVVNRVKGSHHILEKPGHPNKLSVPVHAGKHVGKGLLKSLIAAAGMTVEEFAALL